MADESGVQTLDDIWYDLEGTQKVASRNEEFFALEPLDTISQWNFLGFFPPQAGRHLVAHCDGITQGRYITLLSVESDFHTDWDFGFLIGPACQILESECNRLLTEPARAIVESLIEYLRSEKKGWTQADILERWAARNIPTTIGIQSLVLLALRRGCELEVPCIADFLSSRLGPRYVDLLKTKKLGRCLDQIREKFRNPVCHGTATFNAEGYAEFVRLMVANDRFDTWDFRGPHPPNPDADVGFMHHHWHGSHLIVAEEAAHRAEEEAELGRRLKRRTSVTSEPESNEPASNAPACRSPRNMTMLTALRRACQSLKTGLRSPILGRKAR
jgi:hypothetical protein